MSQRATLDDWDRNSSFFAQAGLDLGELFGGERGGLGTLDLMVNLQRLDVGASFRLGSWPTTRISKTVIL